MNGVEFANAVGIAHGTIKRYLHEGMPAIRARNGKERINIDLEEGKAWIAARYPYSLARDRRSVVYFVERGGDGAIKIGFTSDLERRLRELRKENKTDITFLAAFTGSKPVELALHSKFASDRIDPNEEWFRPSLLIRAFLNRLCAI